jgi:hypothetical protein
MFISCFEKLIIFFNATIELYIYPNNDYEHIAHICIHLTNKFSHIHILNFLMCSIHFGTWSNIVMKSNHMP